MKCAMIKKYGGPFFIKKGHCNGRMVRWSDGQF